MKKIIAVTGLVTTLAITLLVPAAISINNKPVTVAAAAVEVEEKETIIVETPKEEPETPREPKKLIPILDSVPLDAELQKWIYEYSYDLGISPYLVYAIIETESNFDTEAVANTANEYSIGLMQINTYWHKERMEKFEVTDLTNPKQNLKVGIDFLLELFRWREGATLEWVLMAYNGGPGYADEKIAEGTISDYAYYIIERSMELEEEGKLYE